MSFSSIKKNWEGLAKKDPYWSICTNPDKKGNKWNETEFFLTGEKEINLLLQYLRSRNIDLPDHDLLLEFGCGVGRLLRAIYPHFNSLIGLDISTTMIGKAKSLNGPYLNKITFHTLKGSPQLSVDAGSVSVILSLIVFQHIPPEMTYHYLQELMCLLKPGGLLIFQAITDDIRNLTLWKRIRSELRIRERLALIGIGDHFQMAMNVIDQQEIIGLLEINDGEILDIGITNHTDPAYDGNLKFIKAEECIDYISRLFVVRKTITD